MKISTYSFLIIVSSLSVLIVAPGLAQAPVAQTVRAQEIIVRDQSPENMSSSVRTFWFSDVQLDGLGLSADEKKALKACIMDHRGFMGRAELEQLISDVSARLSGVKRLSGKISYGIAGGVFIVQRDE